MERLPQKTTGHSLTKQNSSASCDIVAVLNNQELKAGERYGLILASVPTSIDKALDRPPITELVRQGAKMNDLESCLALEIVKASHMVTVGGNLRDGHSLEIAKKLLAEYPNESFEDFCLMLRNGCSGRYGDIFRFDIIVIGKWMNEYLEEKYQAFEDRLMREKESVHELAKRTSSDWLELMKEAVKKSDEEAPTKTVPQSKIFMQRIQDLTDKEIEREGQERPKKQAYPSTSASEVRQRELHIQWIKENFDPRTGEKLPTWQPEEIWVKNKT